MKAIRIELDEIGYTLLMVSEDFATGSRVTRWLIRQEETKHWNVLQFFKAYEKLKEKHSEY